MTDTDIQHFLVIYDIPNGRAEVESFGTDYEAALAAYADAEEETRGRDDRDIVLLGADSIETIKLTHSSYFETVSGFERLVRGALAHSA